MKKTKTESDDELRPEYDLGELLKGAVRGKYYQAMQSGYTITVHQQDGTTVVKQIKPPKGTVVLEPDVRQYFPDSESVNNTLRSLIQLVPSKRHTLSSKGNGARSKRRVLGTKQHKSVRSK